MNEVSSRTPATGSRTDLVLEVDVSSSSLDRIEIFRAMGVPEVWRHVETGGLVFYGLAEDGAYLERERSLAFPFLSSTVLSGFLELRSKKDTGTVLRDFKAWLRGQ